VAGQNYLPPPAGRDSLGWVLTKKRPAALCAVAAFFASSCRLKTSFQLHESLEPFRLSSMRITSRLRRDVILLGWYLQSKALQRFALSQPFLIHPVA